MSTLLKSLREKNRTAVIDRLIKRLHALADPDRIERIYLFGSWARGDFDGYSDIDLLVILRPGVSEQDVDPGLDQMGGEHAVDGVFTHADEYARRLRHGDPFFGEIDRDKLLVWSAARPSNPSPASSADTAAPEN